MQDGTDGDENLIAAACTLVKPAVFDVIALGSAAPWTGPVFGPALLEEKAGAVLLVAKRR